MTSKLENAVGLLTAAFMSLRDISESAKEQLVGDVGDFMILFAAGLEHTVFTLTKTVSDALVPVLLLQSNSAEQVDQFQTGV